MTVLDSVTAGDVRVSVEIVRSFAAAAEKIPHHDHARTIEEICEDAGVEVVRIPMPDGLGGIIDRPGKRIVLVHDLLAGEDADAVIAHELGHLVFGEVRRTTTMLIPLDVEEQLCQQFADDLLRSRA